MMKHFAMSMLTFAATMFAAPCPAPIFGFYTGTEDLILDADAIVIADVGDLCLPEEIRKSRGGQPWGVMRPANSGMPDQHECCILRTLKGDVATGEALLAIRWLGPPHNFERPEWMRSGEKLPFGTGVRGTYLIFLEGEPPLETVNRVGCIFPVPDGFKVEDLDGKSMTEAVSWITGDVPPTEVSPSKATPEQRAQRRQTRLQHSRRYDRDICDPPVQVMENMLGKPGFNPATGYMRTPSPLPPSEYDPTNGAAGDGSMIQPETK